MEAGDACAVGRYARKMVTVFTCETSELIGSDL